MHIFNLSPTQKSQKWFVEHKLCLSAMSSALTLLYAELEPSKKITVKKIKIQILFKSDSSMYQFKTNKLYISDMPYMQSDSQRIKHLMIFDHILHEFRHWMQSQVYKRSPRELTYTDEDVVKNTIAYCRNELEKDARQFVRHYLSKFYRYYIKFAKISQR
jgi:hypothetical protein